MDRSFKEKINEETVIALNDILGQKGLTDIFRIFHPKTAEYIFFSSACGTFSRVDHILGRKTSLKNSKKLKSYYASSLPAML